MFTDNETRARPHGRVPAKSDGKTEPRLDMDIRTKRVYEPPEPGDGTRFLVDRLWPRGVSKESLRLNGWLRELAPSDALRRWFGHDPSRWAEFRRRYREELAGKSDALAVLRAAAARGPVTLLYAARDPVHNQAVVLRELLLEDSVGSGSDLDRTQAPGGRHAAGTRSHPGRTSFEQRPAGARSKRPKSSQP